MTRWRVAHSRILEGGGKHIEEHPEELSLSLSDKKGDAKNTDPEEGSDEESGNKLSPTNEFSECPTSSKNLEDSSCTDGISN